MKSNAFERHKYSGELYKFVRKTVGDTSTLEYYFVGPINIVPGLNKANQFTLRCDEPLAIGCLISNIKDSNNDLILGNTIWQVSNVEPILDAFSRVIAYRMRTVKFQGVI